MTPAALVLALMASPAGSPSAPASWWELAFRQQDWDGAAALAVEHGAPSARALSRILRLESAASALSDPLAGVPPEPRIRHGVLANHWEAWALAAAFEGASSDALRGALDLALEHSDRAYPERQKARIARARQVLLEELGGADARAALEALDGQRGTTVLRSGGLPTTVDGRLVLLAGTYRFREAVRVPGDAELWIERGTSLVPTAEDAALLIGGAVRVFGAPPDPVTIGGGREWRGVEYQSDVQHVLSDVHVRGARSGVVVLGSRLHLLDAVVEDCAVGIDADSYNVWCEGVLLSGCTDRGFAQKRDNGSSFLRDCTVRGNEVGVWLTEGGELEVYSTEFARNAVPIRALSRHCALLVRRSNFIGRRPLELHPGRPFDLRGNYWGTKSPTLGREVQFSGSAKTDDVLFEPALDEPASAGAPARD